MTPPTQQDKPIDLEALRLAAEAATPGPWVHRFDPGNPVGVQHGVKLTGEHGQWVCDCLDNADRKPFSKRAGDRNAAFIAEWNPATALALLALIEAQQRQIDGLLPALRRMADDFDGCYADGEPALIAARAAIANAAGIKP